MTDDIDRLIALWDSPDYDDGGPLPADQQADDDSATWCVWEGGPFAEHARTSAHRFDRWWRENAATPTTNDSRSLTMSGITVHVYDGDAEKYVDHEEAATVGTRIDGEQRYFHDGEELQAAVDIIELLRDGKHFDVRQVID